MQEFLICFKSGHYKSFKGEWLGDSIWIHFRDVKGNTIHINKNEVEYISHKPVTSEEKPRLDENNEGC